MGKTRISAWLIGENSLVTECAAVLRDRGHQVLGVISPNAEIRGLAAGLGFRVEEHGPDLPEVLGAEPFGYLFSVVNMRMLPPAVLDMPSELAVNFHDASLPRNAGVHAAAWAVLDGASQHGVTWHVMTAEADAGDILATREFPVEMDTTSHDVNVACWRAGLESFAGLVSDIESSSVHRIRQDRSLRTYHGRLDRPSFVLSWDQPAARICALVRAADFGPHPNAFGVAKLLTGSGRWVIPGRARHAERVAGAIPGTVLRIAASEVLVATSGGAVALSGFLGLDGVPLAAADLFTEGTVLATAADPEVPDPEVEAAVRAERHWVARLADPRPLELPAAGHTGQYQVPVPDWTGADPALLAAGVLAYLGEVTGEQGFDVGLRLPAGHALLADVVPLRSPARATDFTGYAAEVARRLAGVKARYLKDLATRYPALASRPLTPPVVLSMDDRADLPDGAKILIRVTAGCCVLTGPESLAGGLAEFLAGLNDLGVTGAPLASVADQRWQADICNDTATDYPREARVPSLVADWARRTPAATAVVSGPERLSYAELEDRSARLAGYLRGRGVRPGDKVGVLLERSADLVVALLAVLRSGAAYVPLDPVYPAERVQYMLNDAGVVSLVTQSSLTSEMPDAVVLDRCQAEVASAAPLPPHEGDSGDLAYVIYTSGSTGRPKGVKVRHRGLTNFLCSMAREPGLRAGETLLAVTTVCFDIAALELFGPLVTGGTVHVAPAGTVGDGRRLRELLELVRPDVLQATPVTWKALIGAGWGGDPGLTALCGGEALPRDLAGQIRQRSGALWNLYGPTETTIWSTVWRVAADAAVSVGRPIANTSCHVLDPSLRVLPAGFAGELYIGGDGVAAGYHAREELTAERFVQAPRHGVLYRTGDAARREPDGTLTCLGRADGQVKLHGHRIELGEIESVLREHPAVRDACAVVRDERIVAYLTPASGSAVPDGELSAAARRRLPGYMVPAVFGWLEELPQTPNGKIDRKALPAPAAACESAETAEELLAAVLAHCGAEADARFADLGIDSLGAAALTHRLGTLAGVRVPAGAVFTYPTPRALVRHVWGLRSGLAAVDRVDLASEAMLPDDIAPSRQFVLTGATGFLGAFLLAELVATTDAVIHCLVRGADEQAAGKRLRRALEEYGLWTDAVHRRVRAVPGDLSLPLLGLAPDVFDELAMADAVYHAGAYVNAILPYESLRAANVGGTVEALRLAATGRPSAFHHVSTIEVFGEGLEGSLPETHPGGPPETLTGGYAQAKWVAEQLVRQAGARGLPVAIHRLPRIMGHSVTGACQTRDLLWQVLRGCVQAGVCPAVDASCDLVPVDYAAQAVATLPAAGGVYHLTGAARTSFAALTGYLRSAGYDLRELPVQDWEEAVRSQPGNAAASVADVFLDEMTGEGWSGLVLENSVAAAALRPCPEIGSELLRRYLEYFTGTGYLPGVTDSGTASV